jgi:signal transduction histidine kinase
VTSDQVIGQAQEAVLRTLLIALPLLVLGVGIVGWVSLGRALRAVDDMTSQAEAMQSTADGELRVRRTGDEIERLGHTFNALLTRLHHQTRATRQFVADAGHELRNPLSTLRVTLEFAQDADEAGLRSSALRALRELDRLEVLVQDLLVLARTDARDIPVEVDDIDLAALVAEGVSASQQNRPDLTFRFEYEPCWFRGNRLALRSLMANLLDNAARHTRTSVDVSVTVSGGETRIQVVDDGDGLSTEDCERVFERFVRLDESRDRDEGGSGLGLAIVASIAESHGGRAFAAPGPGGHFTITLRDSSSTLPTP